MEDPDAEESSSRVIFFAPPWDSSWVVLLSDTMSSQIKQAKMMAARFTRMVVSKVRKRDDAWSIQRPTAGPKQIAAMLIEIPIRDAARRPPGYAAVVNITAANS
jgi:hypothetical protein